MASVDTDALCAFDKKVAQLGSGASQINDFVYQHWHESNWGDLLQPAPMAVMILSNLTVVASATDFELVEPSRGFARIKYPKSFRASIVQLVDTGTIALERSYANFDEIQKRCAGVKPAVNNIVGLLAGTQAESQQEADDDIRRYLPRQVSQLQTAVRMCLRKAEETDRMFEELLDLTMELHESCTATQGTNEAKLADAAMQAKKISQEQVEQSREAIHDAEKMFNDAADKMPVGMELIGLQLVDSLAYVSHAAADAVLFKFGHAAHGDSAINKAGGIQPAPTMEGRPSIQPGSSYYQTIQPGSGYCQADTIATFAGALSAFLGTNAVDGINWELASVKNGGVKFLRNQMEVFNSRKTGSDESSKRAKELVERGIKLTKDLEAVIFTRPTEQVARLVSEIRQFVLDATEFQVEASNKLGVSPTRAPGFAVPETRPPTASNSLVHSAMRSAQARLEATERQLNNAREFSQTATKQLLAVTSQLGEVMGQIAALDLQEVEWDKIRTILLRAISFLCQLKGCLADIVHFFHSVNNLVSVTMNETVTHFIQLINDATTPTGSSALNKSVSGVSLSNWTRQVIYQQALGAAKVARLVQNVATIYTKIYDSHVHGGVKMLLLMGQFMSGGEAERAKMLDAGRNIAAWATDASGGIQDLILEASFSTSMSPSAPHRLQEQARMQREIEDRRLELQKAFAGILPPAPAEVKRSIADAAKARLEEVTSALESAASNKPTFKPRLGMEI
ncbi:hypothetical protein AURDEDRAFT_154225 [Auricularia subglabra TFB-10046 SS5]|uniref:Uncharacterized protein n=1 Tax=Auricularia subglabra (strain TFB-10046 / SS5) TaxID=717982 RepID=J0WWG1_AURST|nr:hypothetical protein AURDEDRAFT_154225 [Auricularia subglabra TFB-10046 SS5]